MKSFTIATQFTVEANTKEEAMSIVESIVQEAVEIKAGKLLSALKLAKEELTFLFAQKQNEKFWTEESEIRFTAIREAIEKAELPPPPVNENEII